MNLIRRIKEIIIEELLSIAGGVELYKNPKSIKRMGKVRAISDKYGNLYVIDAYSAIHGEIIYMLDNGTKPYNYKDWAKGYRDMYNYKYLFWDGHRDTFYFSDSQKEWYDELVSMRKGERSSTAGLSTIAELIEEVQKKNSQYKFFISKDFENLA